MYKYNKYQEGGMMPPAPPGMGGGMQNQQMQGPPMPQQGGREGDMLKMLFDQLTQAGIINMSFEQFTQLTEQQLQQLVAQAEGMTQEGDGTEQMPQEGEMMPEEGGPRSMMQGAGPDVGMQMMPPTQMRNGGRNKYEDSGDTKSNPWGWKDDNESQIAGFLSQMGGAGTQFAGEAMGKNTGPDKFGSIAGDATAGLGKGITAGAAFGPLGMIIGGVGGLGMGLAEGLSASKNYKDTLKEKSKPREVGDLGTSYNPTFTARNGGRSPQQAEKAYVNQRAKMLSEQRPDVNFSMKGKLSKDSMGIERAGYQDSGYTNQFRQAMIRPENMRPDIPSVTYDQLRSSNKTLAPTQWDSTTYKTDFEIGFDNPGGVDAQIKRLKSLEDEIGHSDTEGYIQQMNWIKALQEGKAARGKYDNDMKKYYSGKPQRKYGNYQEGGYMPNYFGKEAAMANAKAMDQARDQWLADASKASSMGSFGSGWYDYNKAKKEANYRINHPNGGYERYGFQGVDKAKDNYFWDKLDDQQNIRMFWDPNMKIYEEYAQERNDENLNRFKEKPQPKSETHKYKKTITPMYANGGYPIPSMQAPWRNRPYSQAVDYNTPYGNGVDDGGYSMYAQGGRLGKYQTGGPTEFKQDGGEAIQTEIEGGETVTGTPDDVALYGGAKATNVSSRGFKVNGADHGEKNEGGTEGVPFDSEDSKFISSKRLTLNGHPAGKKYGQSVASHTNKILSYFNKAESNPQDRFLNDPIVKAELDQRLKEIENKAMEGKSMKEIADYLKKPDRDFNELMNLITQLNPNDATALMQGQSAQDQEMFAQMMGSQGQVPDPSGLPPSQPQMMRNGGYYKKRFTNGGRYTY